MKEKGMAPIMKQFEVDFKGKKISGNNLIEGNSNINGPVNNNQALPFNREPLLELGRMQIVDYSNIQAPNASNLNRQRSSIENSV